MASRWRSWNLERLDCTLHSDSYNDESKMILPVGKDTGFSKLSISSIVLPKAALGSDDTANSSKSSQCGRGRSLKNRALAYDKPGRRPGEEDQVAGGTRLGLKFLGSEYLYDELFPGLGQSKDLNNTHQTTTSLETSTKSNRFSASKNSDQPNRSSQSSIGFAKIASQTKFPKPSSGPQSNSKTSISKNLVQTTHSGNSSTGGSTWPSLPKANHASAKPSTTTSLPSRTIPSKTNFKEIHLTRKINTGKPSKSSSLSSIRSFAEDEEKRSKENHAPSRPWMKSIITKDISEKSAKPCHLQQTQTDCVLKSSTTLSEYCGNVLSVDHKNNHANVSDNSKVYSDNDCIPAENNHNRKVSVNSSTDKKVMLSNTSCKSAQPLETPTNSSTTSHKCDDHNVIMSDDNHWEFEPPVPSDSTEALTFSSQQIHTDSTPDNICHKATESHDEPNQPVLDDTHHGKSVNSVSSSQPGIYDDDGLKTSDSDHDNPSEMKTEVDDNVNTSKQDQYSTKLNIHRDINPCENVLSVDQQQSVQLSGTMPDCCNLSFAKNTLGATNDHETSQPLPCLEISENAKVLNMDDKSTSDPITDDCTTICEKDEQSLLMSALSDIVHNSGAANIDQESNDVLNSTSGNTNVSLGTDNIEPVLLPDEHNNEESLRTFDSDEQANQCVERSGNDADKTTLDNSDQLEGLPGLFNSEGSQPLPNINDQSNQLADRCAGGNSIEMAGNDDESAQIPQTVTDERVLCNPVTDHQSIKQDNSARINDSVPSANHCPLPCQSNTTTTTSSSSTADHEERSVTTNANPETSDNKNCNQEDTLEECEEELTGEPCDVKLDNLPLSITEEDLLEIIEPYGAAISCTFGEDGSSKTCIVRMSDAISGEWLAASLDGLEIEGHRMQTSLDA